MFHLPGFIDGPKFGIWAYGCHETVIGPRVGTPRKIGGGVWPPSQNPSLFVTLICDLSYVFMAVTADTVSLNIIYEGILLMVLSTMMKKQLILKTYLIEN